MADIPESMKLLPCPNLWCDSAVPPMPFAKRDGSVAVICGCDLHGPAMESRDEAIFAWNTRAAPPAMDRAAVTKLAEQLSHEVEDWRHNAYTRVMLAQMRDRLSAILSTLSADAIRQGEGATTANSAVVPDGWKLVPIEPTPEMRQAAIDELSGPTDFSPKASAWDAIRAYRAMLATTPASHASDGGKA